ncbi:hypothetical protein ES703_43269 [subsurface metagenome]
MPTPKKRPKKSTKIPANLLTTAIVGIYGGDLPPKRRYRSVEVVEKTEPPQEAPKK